MISASNTALAEYLAECQEMLERIVHNLTVVNNGEANKERLAAIYRDMHTIKGSSQLFGFKSIAQIAHALESSLDPVRKELCKLTDDFIDILFLAVDSMTSLLKSIKDKGHEPEHNDFFALLLPKLVATTENSLTQINPISKEKEFPAETIDIGKSLPKNAADLPAQSQEIVNIHREVTAMSQGQNASQDPPTTSPKDEVNVGYEIFEDTQNLAKAPQSDSSTRSRSPSSQLGGTQTPPKGASPPEESQNETIRVHVSLLDNLMNLVGELVLIRNQVLQYSKSKEDDQEFMKMSQRLNILTAELQSDVMKTRMQPIGNVLNKFTRVVRDLGRDLSKKIELELLGTETELDKTILEAIKDPLTHIIRNAVDHGIETPAERVKSGKNELGMIRVKSYHESGQVIIEVADDGRGLERQKIGLKAVEKGLITVESLAKLSDRDVQSLIFAPGFSTADSVSTISGRGVGMDVVKTNVERIGGMVDLTSTAGFGSTIKLKIPLTLAIVPALLVKSVNQRFAIPQAKLVELLRIDTSETSSERLEFIQGKPILRLRGKLLPLIDLTQVIRCDEHHNLNQKEVRVFNIVVLNADKLTFGLVVDEIEDSTDIVVKPLAQFLKDLTLFSGASIMGDGSVALTLDVTGIAENLKSEAEVDETVKGLTHSTTPSVSGHRAETCEFLLVDVGASSPYAIPLTVVSRLEDFNLNDFEYSGEQRVIRYRESLLPIFSLTNFLNLPNLKQSSNQSANVPVVVIKRGDYLYGMEVNMILDVVTYDANIDHQIKDRPGILGTLIANDRIIVVVDILTVIDSFKAKLNSSNSPNAAQTVLNLNTLRKKHRILLVEDSSFFRNQVRRILDNAGFETEIACDGAEAITFLEKVAKNHFSLVLSDIEMPIMDGFAMARKITSTPAFANMPLIALTTNFTPKAIEEGKRSGFVRYLEKLNPEALLVELDQILHIN